MEVSKFLKVLANSKRLAAFEYIAKTCCNCDVTKGLENGNCVTSLVKTLKLPQPTVSNYVKSLLKSGLITKQRRGKNIYLYANSQASEIIKSIKKIE